MSLADLRKGHLVTVFAVTSGAPLDVTRIRGVLIAGRFSTGEIGRTRYWRADGVCENDGRLSIRPYRERDEERIEAAREVAEAEDALGRWRSRENYVRAEAEKLEKEAREHREKEAEARLGADAATVALVDAREKLAKIDEVPT